MTYVEGEGEETGVLEWLMEGSCLTLTIPVLSYKKICSCPLPLSFLIPIYNQITLYSGAEILNLLDK